MTISELRDVLMYSLRDLKDTKGNTLNIYEKMPDVPQVPCVFFSLASPPVEYHKAGGAYGATIIKFKATLLIMRALLSDAQVDFDSFILPRDTNSIMHALEAADVTTIGADYIVVPRMDAYGEITVNGVGYLGGVWAIEVWVS